MDWKYIAGFFDGEGSITHNGSGYRITIPQTNFSVLNQIANSVGAGHVMRVNKRQKHWRQSWTYFISTQADVSRFLKKIYPYLIVKRSRAREVLKTIQPIIETQRQRNLHARLLKSSARKLRQSGLSYRTIGRRLGIDFGYARRLVLSRK
jgi:hypothetical protein